MSDKIIITDCDGVLLDWETAFHKWMESHGHVLVAHGMYDICEQYGMEKPLGNRCFFKVLGTRVSKNTRSL